MSGLFENYKNKATNVPYNEKVFLPDIRKFKDVIIIGATNDHVFEMPFKLSELDMFIISYIQGTEVKLTKKYDPYLFVQREDGTYYYPEDGAVLCELTPEQVEEYITEEDNPWKPGFLPTYSVLFYTLKPNESLLFNDYNQEVFVQMKACVISSLQDKAIDIDEDSISYSKKYKLKVLGTIREKKPEKTTNIVCGGFGYTED